jgi:Ca2+-binding RTX toxin-like protein
VIKPPAEIYIYYLGDKTMAFSTSTVFSLIPDDIDFINYQLNTANLKIVSYNVSGQAIYGYIDNNNVVRTLGTLGSFNALDKSIYVNVNRVPSASDPLGLRSYTGVYNNLKSGQEKWGAANEEFLRKTNSVYSNYLGQNVSNSAFRAGSSADSSALYADPFKTVVDYTPRLISQTISSQTALTRLGIGQSGSSSLDIAFIPSSRSNDQNNQPRSGGSGIFTVFGQYFDHGLDFIEKNGNIGANGQSAKLVIPLSPSDPLYNPTKGVTSITVSRATLANRLGAGADGKFRTSDDVNPGADGKYGTSDDIIGPVNPTYLNRTSAYADLSQAYGSDQQIADLLREWVVDPNNSGKYIAGANLLSGYTLKTAYEFVQSDGTTALTRETIPTLQELRAHLVATGRDDLTWEDIQNYRARDSQGRLIDADPNLAGIQSVSTNQAILLDTNSHIDALRIYKNGSSADTTGILAGVTLGTTLDSRGFPTTITVGGIQNSLSKYINTNTSSIQSDLSATDRAIANELLLRSVSDHYVAGDGRLNENFGLTTTHHIFHQNHVYHLNTIKSKIASQQSQDPSKGAGHAWQIAVTSQPNVTLTAGITVVNNHYEDAQGNYVDATGKISWNQSKLFEAARLINQTEYQHITVEYANFVTPDLPKFSSYNPDLNAGVSLEYSQAAFRFGHSQLRETLDVLDPNGSLTANVQKIALQTAFLNPQGFADNGPAAVSLGLARQVSNEIDEFITPALQQSLLGQPLDLAAINIARGRDLGLATLNEIRKQLRDALVLDKASGTTLHSTLKVEALNPYTSWSDFRNNMIHPESIGNFIAAYSFDGDIAKANAIVGLVDGKVAQGSTAAQGYTLAQAQSFFSGGDQGFQRIDLWIGGLAEKHVVGGQLGTTFNTIFVDQLERLQNGDRFYYLHRIDSEFQEARGIFGEIESQQFKDIVERTTGARHLQGDVFEYADNHIELGETAQLDAKNEHKYGGLSIVFNQGLGVRSKGGLTTGDNGTVITDSAQQYVLDVRLSTGAKGFDSAEVIGGTNNNDFIDGGGGGNTIYGEGGNDRLVGGGANDFIYGGTGNDTLNGSIGDDLLNGGLGDDAIYGGDGVDVLVGEAGNDTLYGEAGNDEFYAGYGNDAAYLGAGNDRVFGGEGYDTVYITGDATNYQVSGFNDSQWKFKVNGGEEKVVADVERIEFSVNGGKYDVITGGRGNDTLFATVNQSLLAGGDGDDVLYDHGNNDYIYGGRGNDTIRASGGNDTVDGGTGDDTFLLEAFSNGSDLYNGGAGIDTIKAQANGVNIGLSGNFGLSNSIEIITADGKTGVTVWGDDKDNILDFSLTTLTDVIIDGWHGNDKIIGNAQANTIRGSAGNDTIDGGAGDDTFLVDGSYAGYNGFDLYNGGVGTDAIKAQDNNAAIGLNGDFGVANSIEEITADGKTNVIVLSDANDNKLDFTYTLLTNIVVDSGNGNDTIIGNAQANTFNGGYGNDSLDGAAGDDTFLAYGYTGYDTYNGGTGNDKIKALINDTSISLAGDFGTSNSIEEITADGKTGVTLLGDYNSNKLDFTDIILTNVAINGGDGNDTIVGNAQANTIAGGNGNDFLDGAAGDDIFFASYDGFDTYNGGTGNDIIKTLYNDTYIGLAGNFGAANSIEEITANGKTNVTLLADSSNNNLNFTNTILTNVIVDGADGQDTIIGNAQANTIRGGYGNDFLDGAAGDDTFLVAFYEGFDTYNGGTGKDTIKAYLTNNISIGLAGNFSAANSIEEITADGKTGVVVLGDTGNNTLDFSSTTLTDVVVDGDDGNDNITGNAQANTLRGGWGNDTLNGGGGNDIFLATSYVPGFDTYQGGDGLDTIKAQENNSIVGISGNFSAANSIEAITADGKTGVVILGDTANNTLDFSSTTLTDVVVDGADGNDNIIGNAQDNTLRGGWGNDTLNGGGGNDTFLATSYIPGFDIYQGGDGIDTIKAQENNSVVGISGNFGAANSIELITADGKTGVVILGDTANNTLDFSSTTLTDVVVDGADGNDNIIGNAQDNTLRGGWGNDTLNGGGGNDTFLATSYIPGFDIYQGGDGVDTIKAQENNSVVGISGNFGAANSIELITADGKTGVVILGDTANNTLDFSSTTLTDVVVDGADGNDNIIGNAQANTLRGGWGNDSLDGGFGNDLLDGGVGNDTYIVDMIGDVINETSTVSTEIDTVKSSVSYTLGANLENLILIGSIATTATGNQLDNVITGNALNNTLTGGAGVDTFVLTKTSIDTITDFATNEKLQVSTSEFGGLTANSLSTTQLLVGAGATTAITTAQRFIFDTTDKSLYFDIDGLNGVSAIKIAVLNGLTALNSSNFLVVNDIITNVQANAIRGSSGNDSISGTAGDDTFLVAYYEGFDIYNGGSGIDIIKALVNDTSIGLAGDFGASNSIEEISADGKTGVTVLGDNSNNNLNFTNTILTNVVVNGADGNDTIIGNAQANIIRGGAGNDSLDGAAGDDTFLVSSYYEGFDIYNGGNGNDTIKALANYTNIGLTGDFGATNSIEEISADGKTDVTVLGDNSNNSLNFTNTILTNVVVNGADGNDTIIGNAQANSIRGGTGNDSLDGAAGDDTFLVSSYYEGFDTYNGGTGNDMIKALANYTNIGLTGDFGATNSIEEISADGKTDVTVLGDNSNNSLNFTNTILTNVVVNGADGNDTIIGNAQANSIRGGTGNDSLDGAAGDDTFLVSSYYEGFDTYNGGTGNDMIKALANYTNIGLTGDFGATNSIEEISADGKTDVTVLGDNSNNSLNFTNTILTNVVLDGADGNDTIIGNAQANTLRGGSGNDSLDGAAGNDVLDGGSGSDTLVGGLGNDIYIVDLAGDVVTETSTITTEIDTVQSAVSYTLGANLENLTLTGSIATTAIGNQLNNIITGNSLNNTFTGGAGVDTFVLNKTSADTITDFATNEKLQISASEFGGLTAGNLATTQLLVGAGATAATTAAQRFIFNTTDKSLYFDSDGLNGSAAVKIGVLAGLPTLNSSNFSIVA